MMTYALVRGILIGDGLVGWHMVKRAVDSYDFIDFFHKIRDNLKGKKIALFLDNLSVHKTNECREVYERLRIKVIFNVA